MCVRNVAFEEVFFLWFRIFRTFGYYYFHEKPGLYFLKMKLKHWRNLSHSFSIEIFNKTADELREWIQEKLDQLKDKDVGVDASTNDALRRRFANIEREMTPIEEKKNKLHYLGDGWVRNK